MVREEPWGDGVSRSPWLEPAHGVLIPRPQAVSGARPAGLVSVARNWGIPVNTPCAGNVHRLVQSCSSLGRPCVPISGQSWGILGFWSHF